MPVIARFHGIIIKMYFLQGEHNPPHIHVKYNEYAAAVDIMTGEILDGSLPVKVLNMVSEWIEIYRDDIKMMWETQEFKMLPPLE